MYARHFGLSQEPFSLAPDPRYLFMSERHREALAHLLYGVKGGGGFVLLTGEIGAGKTTVARCFLEQIPERCNVAYIFNPKLTVEELLRSICDEFRVPYAHAGPGTPTVKDYVDALNEFLLRTHAVGQNNVLVIDEAQNLSVDVLEQLRLLTNLETNERKLLQIILIGQPELRTLLARPELEQLAQRVIARYHLGPLSQRETSHYLRHRLSVAGMTGVVPFDRDARQRMFELTRGVPRRINLLADRALLGAYSRNMARVNREIVDQAAREVFDESHTASELAPRSRRAALIGGAAMLTLVLVAAAWVWQRGAATQSTTIATAATAASPAAAASAPSAAASVALAGAVAETHAASEPAAATAVEVAPIELTSASIDSQFATPVRDERAAWAALAAEWHIEVPSGTVPCQAAASRSIQCYRSVDGGLGLVRLLDRPGFVTLQGADQRPVYALLVGLGVRHATLRMAGESKTVTVASLGRIWRGDFATMWRTPPGWAAQQMQANYGATAGWLAEQLERIEGSGTDSGSAAAGGATSQAGLKERVAAFQRIHGLQADGFAGPATLMVLNRVIGVEEPRLAELPSAPTTARR
jgi:general secretion pathway protein A